MKKQYRLVTLAFAITAGFLSACERQDADQPQPQKNVVQKRQLSAEEQAKADRYKQAALILTQLLHDDKQLLKALSREVEVDKFQHEQISFKELFTVSAIKARGQQNILNDFRIKFEQAISTGKYPHADLFTVANGTAARNSSGSLEDALMQEGVDIYFPYSVYFEDVVNPTVTYAPLDNTLESTGYYYADQNGDGIEEVVEVPVDETYAQQHPTFIIQPLDEQEVALTTESISIPAHRPNGVKDTLNQIKIGYVQLIKNLDPFFGDGAGNSGGSELRFVRPKGYLSIDANGQVDLNKEPAAVVSVDLSRATINDKNRTYQYMTFDSDWNRTEKTQYFVAYEHDNATERTKTTKSTFEVNAGATLPIKGSNSTSGNTKTVGVKTTRELTEELKYKTKEEILWQQDFARPVFFYLNTISQSDLGWRDGFPFWKVYSYLNVTIPREQHIYER